MMQPELADRPRLQDVGDDCVENMAQLELTRMFGERPAVMQGERFGRNHWISYLGLSANHRRIDVLTSGAS